MNKGALLDLLFVNRDLMSQEVFGAIVVIVTVKQLNFKSLLTGGKLPPKLQPGMWGEQISGSAGK